MSDNTPTELRVITIPNPHAADEEAEMRLRYAVEDLLVLGGREIVLPGSIEKSDDIDRMARLVWLWFSQMESDYFLDAFERLLEHGIRLVEVPDAG